MQSDGESQEALIELPAPKAGREYKNKKMTRGTKKSVLEIELELSRSVQHTPLPPSTVEDRGSWIATGRSAFMQAGWLCAGLGLTYLADQVLVRRASH